jgi:hypothetical protein
MVLQDGDTILYESTAGSVQRHERGSSLWITSMGIYILFFVFTLPSLELRVNFQVTRRTEVKLYSREGREEYYSGMIGD